MADTISAENLAGALADALSEYSEELTEYIKKAALEVSEEATKNLKQTSPKQTGSYKKGWRKKRTYTGKFGDIYTTYNKTDYQLTHLLEHGHAKRGGGRVSGIPHIEPVEKQAIENFKRKVESAVHGNS